MPTLRNTEPNSNLRAVGATGGLPASAGTGGQATRDTSAVTHEPVNTFVGPLKPDDLLLVYNDNDPRSRQLAEYYAKARAVPADRLCPVQVTLDREEITRLQYERSIRYEVRSYLEKQPFGRNIRCIVLFYGLPIRVEQRIASMAEQRLAKQWRNQFQTASTKLRQVIEGIEMLATTPPATQSAASMPAADEQAIPNLVQQYHKAHEAAVQRVTARMDTDQGQQEYRQLTGATQSAEGLVGVLKRAQVKDPTPQTISVIQKYVNQARTTKTQMEELRKRALTDPVRESARELIQRNHGLIGVLGSLNFDILMTRTDETTASVDSELTLLWWEPYIPYRWVANTLNWDVRADRAQLSELTQRQPQAPTLMVCRIDGPSVEICRRIIDDSIAAERSGLSGKVYIDARGLKGKDNYAPFDKELRGWADMIKRETQLDVRLDNRPVVFGPGQCPETMLYCGWYSVRNYVGAFTFVPGAVGYHVASFEAVSLKSPAERGWVRGLLKDGITATIGPVAEPYLESFPKPAQFLGLLLTGRFSLAESYAYSNEMNSWMMLLIGDPLYRPFAKNPQLRLDQVYPLDHIPPEFKQGEPARPRTGGYSDTKPHD